MFSKFPFNAKLLLSYLSNAIAQRLRIEAVQQRTSEVSHILHNADPKSHLPTTAIKIRYTLLTDFPGKNSCH